MVTGFLVDVLNVKEILGFNLTHPCVPNKWYIGSQVAYLTMVEKYLVNYKSNVKTRMKICLFSNATFRQLHKKCWPIYYLFSNTYSFSDSLYYVAIRNEWEIVIIDPNIFISRRHMPVNMTWTIDHHAKQ